MCQFMVQERLAANAAAAKARNSALQQSIAEQADARPPASCNYMDAQVSPAQGMPASNGLHMGS